MQILLTNDDGIYAPGLSALEREVNQLGEVTLLAPATEQSGVGHSITYLTPLIVKEIFQDHQHRGWAVEGSPADCVKIGIAEICPSRPDLIVSGINYGFNAGINVLYSGTVAAAIEGAFFGITSIAVSLEFHEQAEFDIAAKLAVKVIKQILEQKDKTAQLYNLNIPRAALTNQNPQLHIVPMGLRHWGEHFEKRVDPRGRNYYWAITEAAEYEEEHETDIDAIHKGHLTLTPMDFNLTQLDKIEEMKKWKFDL